MYITPQTNIRLLSNCPCDPDYINTLHWYSKSAQTTYFMGLTKYNLNSYTYQRHTKNSLRVEINADNLYDVNYMMFQNSAYGSKWFYAFVVDVEFVNNVTSEIFFEIDEMQSWYLDYTMNKCFVERQHGLTDDIGDNILPENIELGEYVYNTYSNISSFTVDGTSAHIDPNDLVTVVAVADIDNDNEISANGTVFERVYTGATYYVYNSTDITSINAKINEYTNRPEGVLSIYTAPRQAVEWIISTGGTCVNDHTGGIGTPYPITFPAITDSALIDGYTPKNNKLYTYPYNFLNIDNGKGDSMVLRYEFFNTVNKLSPQVNVYMNLIAPCNVVIQPRNYKGVEANNHSESLVLDNYPLCCWSVDSWQAWLSQNIMPYAGSAIGVAGVAGLAALGVTSPAAVVGAGAAAIGMAVSGGYKASIGAELTKGNMNGGNTTIANNLQTFFVGRMSVSANYAEVIDNFFTRFGYKQNRLMTPTRDARAKWTYIKTIGCTISGTIPATSEKKIQSIFDNGITIWINPSEVGHYELDNAVSQG